MPIEIRELVIRARVSPGDGTHAAKPAPAAPEAQRTEELIQTCVREVLRVLEDRKER